MKRESVLLAVILGVWGLSISAHADPWLGAGTAESPYLIYNANDMQAIGADPNDWDKHFILMVDIELSGFTGTQFNIIGEWIDWDDVGNIPFSGVFDGNGHTISNFTYTSIGTDYIGLFSYVGTGGEIKALGLTNVNVDGGTGGWVGSLVGRNCGTISNCQAAGIVSGYQYVGGLVGYNRYGRVSNCYATGSATGTTDVGGLVGRNWGGTVSNCYATGTVAGGSEVGALVGWNRGTVLNSYATGGVSGTSNVGGLVGRNSYGRVSNCYATGAVSGDERVGGLVGYNEEVYADSIIFASFWDIQTGGPDNGIGTPVPTAEMQNKSTFADAGWDFVGETANGTNEIWQMPAGGGYPALSSFYGYLAPELLGEGTSEQPYLIGDANELGALYHYDSGANYRLVVDIDLSGISWTTAPIPVFSGCFEGNGHTIASLYIEGGDYLGLFGDVGSGGEIKDLGLTNVNVDAGTGKYYVGGLVGNNDGTVSNCYATGRFTGNVSVGGLIGVNDQGTITKCYATGSVTGYERVGGLVGNNHQGTVSNCQAAGTVTATRCSVGGLVGNNHQGTVSNCYATGNVSARFHVGGLIGWNCGTVSNSQATGSVSGTGRSVGGLVGLNDDGTVSNCYATGNVWGDYRVGGLVGFNYYGTVSNSYATGAVEGWGWRGLVGGLVGVNEGTVSNCYATGNVGGEWVVGGLLGWNLGTVSNCHATGDVTGTSDYVGGLVGDNDGTVSNCYATGSVTGDDGVGGLMGDNDGTVSNCYATGSVMGDDPVGGLVGGNGGTVSNCYAAGDVTGDYRVGGLLGYNDDTVSNCYATGSVMGDHPVGGLVGGNFYAGSYTSCFWDSDINSGFTGVGNMIPDPLGVMGRTTVQMQTESTFTDYGWDFFGESANGTEDIWKFIRPHEDYPRLSWQPEIVGDFVGLYGVNMIDFAFFVQRWLKGCSGPGWCNHTDIDESGLVDMADFAKFAKHWLASAGEAMNIELTLDNSWMYQNLEGQTSCSLTADVSIIGGQYNNSSYTYKWEIILPDDVSVAPAIMGGGGFSDPCCTFAAPSCNEPNGLSDSGQTFTVRVTITGNDYGNSGIAEAEFGIALLGDANNDGVVNVADRAIINAFWRLGAAGPFTFTDCNINCDTAINVADRSIANAVWRGVLGQNRVSNPCPLR